MSSAMTTQRATLIGLLAPLCWDRCGMPLFRHRHSGSADRRQAIPHFWSADSQRELALLHALYLFFCWRNADDGGGHGELPLARSDTPFCRGL